MASSETVARVVGILSGRNAEPMQQNAALISEGGGRATVVLGDVHIPEIVIRPNKDFDF